MRSPFFKKGFLVVGSILLVSPLLARPLITEEFNTIGKFHFETGTSISFRVDKFNSPSSRYETVLFPVFFKFGATSRLDLGFDLRHETHRVYTANSRFSGSYTGSWDLNFKYNISDNIGLNGIWYTHHKGKDQDLPIVRGNDYEFNLLLTAPWDWRPNLNIGYVFRGPYQSDLGINGVTDFPQDNVRPGDIFQTRGSFEIPLNFHFYLLTEAAYYSVADQTVGNTTLNYSSGEALDAWVGLTWIWKGWNIGGGVGFGLLEESHTSFALDRGAGDTMYKFSLAYRLKPVKPEKWE